MIDHVTNRVKLYIKYNCFSVVYASVIGFQAAILLPRNFMNQYRARTDLTEIILSLYKGKKLNLICRELSLGILEIKPITHK